MSGPWRRLAVAGSVEWPTEPAWHAEVTEPLWGYLTRLPPDCTLYVRHGDAADGPDNITHRWTQALISGAATNPRPDVTVVEERVPADWAACGPACPETKADGEPHRRPNPGYPDHPKRGHLQTYCPSAGHRRNPEVVGFVYDGPLNRQERKHYQPIPGVRVSLLMAWIYNNSPGTSATVRHAANMRVPHRVWAAYG